MNNVVVILEVCTKHIDGRNLIDETSDYFSIN
jgi:hypothetical protein